MRELKFRTWDTEYKEFSEWTNRDPFFHTSNGEISFWERTRKEDGSYDGDIMLQDQGNRFILQQYEGDIVKIHPWNSPKKELENYLCKSLKQIKWGLDVNGQYPTVGFVAINLDPADLEDGHQLNWMDASNIEVVGNIFENSELLKQ